MNKLFKISIIGSILFCLLVSLAPATMASDSYVVHGQITDHSGGHPNGVTITVTDTDLDKSLTVTTYTDGNGDDGTFQVNLGNILPANLSWSRGDTITISASSGGYTGSTSFNIPDTGTIYGQDLTLDTKEAAGGGGGRERSTPGLGSGFEMWFIVIIFLLIAFVLLAAYMNRKKDR